MEMFKYIVTNLQIDMSYFIDTEIFQENTLQVHCYFWKCPSTFTRNNSKYNNVCKFLYTSAHQSFFNTILNSLKMNVGCQTCCRTINIFQFSQAGRRNHSS